MRTIIWKDAEEKREGVRKWVRERERETALTERSSIRVCRRWDERGRRRSLKVDDGIYADWKLGWSYEKQRNVQNLFPKVIQLESLVFAILMSASVMFNFEAVLRIILVAVNAGETGKPNVITQGILCFNEASLSSSFVLTVAASKDGARGFEGVPKKTSLSNFPVYPSRRGGRTQGWLFRWAKSAALCKVMYKCSETCQRWRV